MHKKVQKCPICTTELSNSVNTAPFCSNRCKEIDLHKWFTQAYSVPVVEYDDIDSEDLESSLTSENDE